MGHSADTTLGFESPTRDYLSWSPCTMKSLFTQQQQRWRLESRDLDPGRSQAAILRDLIRDLLGSYDSNWDHVPLILFIPCITVGNYEILVICLHF